MRIFFFFWLCHTASWTLAPGPGIKPGPMAMKVQHPNYWTARKFPLSFFYFDNHVIKDGKQCPLVSRKTDLEIVILCLSKQDKICNTA